MNARKAKAIRRAARGLTQNLVEAGREIHSDGYLVIQKRGPVQPLQETFELREAVDPLQSRPMQPTFQVIVRPDSVKGIYKRLKSGRVS